MRLVTAGDGATRDVVLVYHAHPRTDADVKDAAPGAIVVNDTGAAFSSYYSKVGSLDAILDKVRALVPGVDFGRVIVCGWSEGCQASRVILNAAAKDGASEPDALVLADGTNATLPVTGIETWSRFAEEAKASKRVMVASHTMLTYVETLASPYASTLRVLRAMTGFPLDRPGPLDAPGRSQEGDCIVYSYATTDGPGHAFQLTTALPRMLAEAIDVLKGGPAFATMGGVLLAIGIHAAGAFVGAWLGQKF